MKNWISQFRLLINGNRTALREHDSAQERFVRAIYSNQGRLGFDYEKPAYLRRTKTIILS